MIKEYFTDGLLQIAIVLSLLRTDLDSFVGLSYDSHRLSPELHETFLGSLSGYTQTDIRSRNLWNAAGIRGAIHPKNIDNSYPESIFSELHSLSDGRRFEGIERNLNAFLVNVPDSQPPRGQRSNGEPASSPDAGQAAEGGSSLPNDDGNALEGAVSSFDFLPYSEDDLTKEEMELIEVLWRQDIDLGIGREMFESSLRQEEPDDNDSEISSEKTLNQEIKKVEESESGENRGSFPVLDLSANYVIDGETGEIVSLPPVPPPSAALQHQSPESIAGVSFFDIFPDIMDLPDPDGGVPSYGNDLPPLEEQSVVLPSEFHPQVIYEDQPPPSFLLEQSADNLSDFSHQLSRQNSLEQRWSDVIGLLNLSDFLGDGLNQTTLPPDPMQPVVQNVSLAMPHEFQASSLSSYPTYLETEAGGMTSYEADADRSAVDGASSPGIPFGDTNATFLNMDDVSALASAHYAGLGPETSGNISYFSSADLESLFQHIFDDNNFDANNDNLEGGGGGGAFEFDASPPPSGVGDGLHTAGDSLSSDSAISSLSPSSPPLLLYHPMDQSDGGADEAVGGKDVVVSKCDLDLEKYRYSADDPDFQSGSPFLETNSSTSSNDTNFRASKKSLVKHVYHNHTYILQPGQASREEKEEALKRDRDQRATRSRDERRAKEMKLPFTVAEIIDTPVEDFAQMMSRHALSEAQQQLVRDIRRRGKNKQAAQNCRKRKMNVIQTLEEEVACLQREQGSLVQNRRSLDRETAHIKDKLVRLQAELFRSLRDDNGQPYNPSEYSLQQLPGGNVFLVPKNGTVVEKGHAEKPVRKRKPKRKE